MPLRNIASVGQSRIVTDKEWSFTSRSYVPVTYENYSERVGDEHLLTVIQRIFSKDGAHLGALGRKLLAAHSVYDAPGQKTIPMLKRIWDMFVSLSLKHHPDLSDDEIIDSIMRAEKFSKSFRGKLSRKIQLSKS